MIGRLDATMDQTCANAAAKLRNGRPWGTDRVDATAATRRSHMGRVDAATVVSCLIPLLCRAT